MEANEMPERIYLLDYNNAMVTPLEGDTVYVREDAFIEKACEWLKEHFLFDEAGYCQTNIYSKESMIYNFKNTLGGKL